MGDLRPADESLILPIKGMFYETGGKLLRKRLLPGRDLLLRPFDVSEDEDTHWHDPFAVEVVAKNGNEVRIGWVPRTHSRMVRRLLDENLLVSSRVWRVGTNEKLRWIVSMEIRYRKQSVEEERLNRILESMVVPSREYAKLIATSTPAESPSEREWVDVYNESVFDEMEDS
jgi:hypothetical protein